jgi:hypothetical protein
LESMRPPPTASPKIIPTFRYTYHNRCDKTTCITSTTLVLRKTTKPNMAILGVRDCENMRKFSSCVLSEISSFSFLEHRNLAKSNRFGNSIATDWILKNFETSQDSQPTKVWSLSIQKAPSWQGYSIFRNLETQLMQ